MLESMLGPEVMNKIMAKTATLISVILAWIGLIMVMMTAFVSTKDALDQWTVIQIYHAHLWPMLIGFFCAATALVTGSRKVKMYLGYVLLIFSLWVMIDQFFKLAPGPQIGGTVDIGMGEAIIPMMGPVAVIGGFLGFLGGVVGIMGPMKYMK